MLSQKAIQVIQKFKKKQSSEFGLFKTNGKELRYLNYRIARHHALKDEIIWDNRNYSDEDSLVVNQVKRLFDERNSI